MLFRCYDCGGIFNTDKGIWDYKGSYAAPVCFCFECYAKNRSEITSFDYGIFPRKTPNTKSEKEILTELNKKS